MKKLIALICVGLLAAPLTAAQASEAQMANLEAQMQEARRALDEAARRLAELHTAKYGGDQSSKKAMLGILLGDGSVRGGVEMVGVTPGGGAEEAGLRAGDKIVRIGDIDLSDVKKPMRELSRFMKQVTPGESVAVVYERDGEEVDAVIVTRAHSNHIMQMVTKSLDNLDFNFDFDFDDMPQVAVHGGGTTSDSLMFVEGDLAQYFDVDQGVVVTQVAQDSQLKGGDVLLLIGDENVTSVADALVALGKDEAVQVRVKRKGRNMNLEVAAGEFDQVVKEEIRVIRVKKPGADQDIHIEVISD